MCWASKRKMKSRSKVTLQLWPDLTFYYIAHQLQRTSHKPNIQYMHYMIQRLPPYCLFRAVLITFILYFVCVCNFKDLYTCTPSVFKKKINPTHRNIFNVIMIKYWTTDIILFLWLYPYSSCNSIYFFNLKKSNKI